LGLKYGGDAGSGLINITALEIPSTRSRITYDPWLSGGENEKVNVLVVVVKDGAGVD